MNTVVNTATGEITETLTEDEARRLTDRIRNLAENVAEQVEKMAGLIDEARIGSAWLVLGYASWTAYVADEFANVLPRLDREPRREFVRELAERGMSTRAIAPIVGANHSTVVRDLNSGGADAPPVPNQAAIDAARERVAARFPREDHEQKNLSDLTPEDFIGKPAATVTGIDGKSYTRPTPKPTPAPRLRVAPDPVEYAEQDHAEELARNLSRNLSLLFAVTNPERRAEYIATWRTGTKEVQPLGWDFITPERMRALADALESFASEWENADV